MFKLVLVANLALLLADRIWDFGVGVIAALVVIPIVYLAARLQGRPVSRIEKVVLVAVLVALAATDLYNAGLLPVIHI